MTKKSKKKKLPTAHVRADRRFIIDQFGRRIGHMWPEDFEANLRALYGKRWIADISTHMGMSRDNIDKYRKGISPIPKHFARHVLLLRWYSMNKPRKLVNHVPKLETPWLDNGAFRESSHAIAARQSGKAVGL